MKAMIGFMKTMFSLPAPIRLWLGLLMALNMFVPFLFITTPEAQWTVVAAIAGAMTMAKIFQARGFVRLIGIGHIYWVPLVIWFAMRLDAAPSGGLFRYWMLSIIVLNSISIVIDVIDVLRYIKGDRAPFVR